MANPEHLEVLKQGVDVWNEWRSKTKEKADLSGADLSGDCLREVYLSGADLYKTELFETDLSGAQLCGADLREADLCEATLFYANLSDANLNGANLRGAKLGFAKLSGVEFCGANLCGAYIRGADFYGANLRKANLSGADLREADFSESCLSEVDLSLSYLSQTNLNGAGLIDTDLSKAVLGRTVFANVDLSAARGLATAEHLGPSTIGIDTLYQSKGQIPEVFLRGCGVPESFITQARALIGAEEGIQFYSCFISYSTKDEEFARRLHARLQQEHIRVWFAPHDMKSGEKLHEQIDTAIKVYDKLLILLSPNSLQSNWVMTELRKARKAERKTGKRKLFPLGLTDFKTLKDWECFDSDTGTDLAVEVREYFIPDFTSWKDHDAFEAAFARLLKDLRQSTQSAPTP